MDAGRESTIYSVCTSNTIEISRDRDEDGKSTNLGLSGGNVRRAEKGCCVNRGTHHKKQRNAFGGF